MAKSVKTKSTTSKTTKATQKVRKTAPATSPNSELKADSKVIKVARKLRPRSPFRGYFVESWREIRRVKWPKRRDAWKLTFAVIVFSVLFAAFLATLDLLFEKLAKVIFLR